MDNKLIVEDNNGNSRECEILLTFERDGTNYLVYTDYSTDEDGNYKVFANIYDPEGEDQKLYPIKTEEEWQMVEAVLANAQTMTEDEI